MITELQAVKDTGLNIGEIDEAAVTKFLAPVGECSAEKLQGVADRMARDITSKKKVGGANLATMGEVVRRLREMI